MSHKDDGGLAFPGQRWMNIAETYGSNAAMPQALPGWAKADYPGMSLRDYFAGQALAGMHARDTFDDGQATPEQRAHLAYIDADAMLKERSK